MNKILLGNNDALKSHWYGLAEMIFVRGGLHSLGLDGLLSEMSRW
jgi:hypothetical protein